MRFGILSLMKKIVTILVILVFVVVILVVAFSLNREGTRNKGLALSSVYECTYSGQIIKPKLILKCNQQFEFFYSVDSSYTPKGTYRIEKKKLYLETYDGKYVFVFSIKNDTLFFCRDKSVLPGNFANIEEKAVFVSKSE